MDHKTRLRKACDACSIRKVKVGPAVFRYPQISVLIPRSVIPVARHVGPALAWIFLAPMRGLVDVVGLPIAMQKH